MPMTSGGASLSIVGAATAAPADLSEPEAESALVDVREAYAALEAARDAAERAKSILVESIRDAYIEGHGPRAIAAEMIGRDGEAVTRQYVQKLLRESDAAEAEQAAMEAALIRSAERDGRLSGWRQTPQCSGCKRILKRPDDVCPNCGYAGHGGYVGVPAASSYLERWR